MLTELWKELGFGELRRLFGRTRHTTDIEALIRVMVLNRLCDPDSKLGVYYVIDLPLTHFITQRRRRARIAA